MCIRDSLGVLEEAVASAAGIFGTWQVDFGKKAVVILCADNGIVEEGIDVYKRQLLC